MTEEQRMEFEKLCCSYRGAKAGYAWEPYNELRDYVETLIDEAVKDAITAHKADKK